MIQSCLVALSRLGIAVIVLATTQPLISPGIALAQSTPAMVPTVTRQTFEPGRFWTWEYREGETFYSTERYTVLEKTGDRLLIEMSTRFKPGEGFRAHHRIEVYLSRCLGAYANPVSRKPWTLTMFHLDADSKWQAFNPETTLAFEEKFNCNPHVYRGYGANYRTVFSQGANGPLFEQKRWGRLDGTRFFFSGDHAGIGAEKRFAKPKGESYNFRLVAPDVNAAAADGV